MDVDPNNPYRNRVNFEEEETEDIIKMSFRPIEAAIDKEGDEIIELKEQNQEVFTDQDPDEVIVADETSGILTVEEILKEAEVYAAGQPAHPSPDA